MQAITIKLFIALILSTLLVACGGSSDDADSEIQDPVGNEGAKLSPDTPATNNPDATDDSESTDTSVPDGAEYTFASLPLHHSLLTSPIMQSMSVARNCI